MNGKDDTKRIVDFKQAMWITLPKTGQVLRKLDENGVVHITGENPEFAGTPYCVLLGLRVNERGPQIRYGTPDSPMDGDYFYAEVQRRGSFDIHLKAKRLSNQDVTIVWCAIPQSSTCIIHTLGPTPIPTKPPGGGPTIEGFDPKDFPGRYVDEVPGIDPEFARRLTEGGIQNLATLASAGATRVARILTISEVRAMEFIDQARDLLRGKTRK